MQVFFYGVLFFPAGVLLGITVRQFQKSFFEWLLTSMTFILIPAAAFESLLLHVSGRGISLGSLLLSMGFGIAGIIWINLRMPRPVILGN